MTWRLWLADALKGAAARRSSSACRSSPLVLWIMAASGPLWWLWAWAAWMAFNLLALVVVPTVIAPLFNRFEPLADAVARGARAGADGARRLRGQGPVRDGRQPALGARQRLLHRLRRGQAGRLLRHPAARLAPGEVEAVLAHELGHFKLQPHRQAHRGDARRQRWRVRAARLARRRSAWFYTGLGVAPEPRRRRTTRWRCCSSCWSRAGVRRLRRAAASPAVAARTSSRPTPTPARQADGRDLASALLKLHEDNASTLTPDPVLRPLLLFASAGRRAAGRACPRACAADGAMTNFLEQTLREARRRDERRRRPRHLAQISGWRAVGGAIEKTFAFKGWLETVAFVERAGLGLPRRGPPSRAARLATTAAWSASRHALGRRHLAQRLHLRRQGRCPRRLRRLTLAGRVVSGHGRHVVVEAADGRRVLCHPRGKKSETASSATGCAGSRRGDEGVVEAVAAAAQPAAIGRTSGRRRRSPPTSTSCWSWSPPSRCSASRSWRGR